MPRDEDEFPEVFRRVKELYRRGSVALTYHAKQRKDKRRIETPDLENLIRFGRMMEKRMDPRHSNPSYTIIGTTLDNEKIGCAVTIDAEILRVITVFWRGKVG